MSTFALQRSDQQISIKPNARKRKKSVAEKIIMYVTVDAEWVTPLRYLVMDSFGELVSFMRIQPIDHATKMKVCLSMAGPLSDHLMAAIMRTLPSAEFGHIKPAV